MESFPALASSVRGRLTYANVAATLALVLALGGTAYAAAPPLAKKLPKNSVASKQIKNGAVTTKDVKDAGLTGADVAPNSLGGDQVDEATLGRVPDAAALGGVGAAGYARTALTVSGAFAVQDLNDLVADVPGYGRFGLNCQKHALAPDDDTLYFNWLHQLGAGARIAARVSASPDDLSPATTTVHYSSQFANGASVTSGDRIYADALFTSADGSEVVRVVASGYDDPQVNGCFGTISAEVLK